jgi:hypothetical protein
LHSTSKKETHTEIFKKMSTFSERLEMFLGISHPRYIFTGEAEARAAQKALLDPKVSDDLRKQNQQLVDAVIHPASDKLINWTVRVASIAPVNIPLIFAMLKCPPTNIPGTLFLHWVNQSYNAYTNYEHRSGKDVDVEASLKAYGLATFSACGLAYGAGKLMTNAPPSIKRFGILIPCLATSAANVSNLVFTRMDEYLSGSMVKDAEGNELGKSRVAGTIGIVQSACTRAVMLPCSCLLLPPTAEMIAGRLKLLPSSNIGLTLFRLSFIYLSLQGALPAALAVFPQTIELEAANLEEPFRNLKDSKGQPITKMFSNKGL